MDSMRPLSQGARGRNQPSGQHSAPVPFLFPGARGERPSFRNYWLQDLRSNANLKHIAGLRANTVLLHMAMMPSLTRKREFIGHFCCLVFSMIYYSANASRVYKKTAS